MHSNNPGYFFCVRLPAAALLSLAAFAAQGDNSGISIMHRTPDAFCRGTARSIAVDRYTMKKDAVPIQKALQQNGGVAVIDAITKAVYGQDVKSDAQAADAGTLACLNHSR